MLLSHWVLSLSIIRAEKDLKAKKEIDRMAANTAMRMTTKSTRGLTGRVATPVRPNRRALVTRASENGAGTVVEAKKVSS